MHLSALLKHFDCYQRLHIEVNTVRDQIIDLGFQDEIRFHFVNIEQDVLRGLLYRYIRHDTPYGDPIRCSEICIAKDLSEEWRRLVAVKELLHITDTQQETAESEAAVEKLIERLALPLDVQAETESSINDRFLILPALAVLVPKGCRDILKSLHRSGRITNVDVANMAKIPVRYADVVLEDWFDKFIESLNGDE